ncbi:hypothetical protein E4T56_gene13744 [Termitomyces sp. T112]|nr:hypothetical protein E4T56_gene13744 [Termitomyces sp. T112]
MLLDDNSLLSLLEKQIEEHEDIIEDWLQKEAMVCEIIYAIVDQYTSHQIKREPTAAAVWKKLTSIYSDRGAMFETDLLAQLQNSHFIENGEVSMHNYLASLAVIKECLAEINCSISNASYVSYIHTSLSLAPSYKPLITTVFANACITKKPISSKDLIWHLNKEANNAAIKTSINQHHEAMVMAHAKAKSESKGAKEKAKSKGKGMISIIATIVERTDIPVANALKKA